MKLLVLVVAAITAAAPLARAATDAAAIRAIAIAEDQRRWSDGEIKHAFDNPMASVRARAALAAGRIQDSTAVDALAMLLNDSSPAVRYEAIFALGQLGSRLALPFLRGALVDNDVQAVELTIEALGKIGDRRSTESIVPFMREQSPALRAASAVALWRIADTLAAPTLVACLGDPDPAVRWRMVYALEKLPTMASRIAPSVVPMLHDPDPLVRAHAARTLGRLKAPGVTLELVHACDDVDPAVVVNAIRALQSIADTTTVGQMPALLAALGRTDPAVRLTAATALAERFAWTAEPGVYVDSADPRVETLARGLADPDAATRGACARALIMRFGAAGLERARFVLADTSVYARVAALDGLRQRGEPALAAPLLAASLLFERPLLERMTAAEIVGQLHNRPGGGQLASLLPTLRDGVHDPNVLYAASCAGALGDWGDTASVPMLAAEYVGRGQSADADARISIRDALRQLAGRSYTDRLEHDHPAPAAPASFPPDFAQPPTEKGAVIHTAAGDIEWEFLRQDAPQTVRNFVKLARSGYFNGSRVHRVVPDFVIQDGDPTGTGSGGPGWTIRCEYNRRRYETGMVGMALSGKDTGGSQWFITLSPQPHLDGKYTIFARVTKGMEVARRITQGTVIERVEIRP